MKKVMWAGVEREFKAEQMQFSYVIKLHEKYEQDCMHINAHTTETILVSRWDLKKGRLKLERAVCEGVGGDVLAVGESVDGFCDCAQDMEEDREVLWGYMNVMSAVSVSMRYILFPLLFPLFNYVNSLPSSAKCGASTWNRWK